MNLTERQVIIELSEKKDNDTKIKKTLMSGIDVKFNIDIFRGSINNKARIDICNLTKENIEYLTSFYAWDKELNKEKMIKISAGYKDKNVAILFSGDIYKALPTQPPDIWIRCEAMSGYWKNQKHISESMTGEFSIKDIAEKIASNLGLKLDFQVKNKRSLLKKIIDFIYSGGLTGMIHKITSMLDVVAYEDNGKLVVADKEMSFSDIPFKAGQKVKIISEETGMIGIPTPDAVGVVYTTLLDTATKIGEVIYLKSKRIPACNGYYFVYHINYSGHLRGTEFYSTFECRRIGGTN